MTAIVHPRTEYFGLRPLDPMRDLKGMADLIEEAFLDDLDHSGRSSLRELRMLNYLKPIVWWMINFSSDHSDFLSGFVWEEDKQIVGNITVHRVSHGSKHWLISNLAVSSNYQRQGIGYCLLYAGVELVRECNGSSVALQVREDNIPAKHLYNRLNFKKISGITELKLNKVVSIDTLPPLPANLFFRPRNFSVADSRMAYNLAVAVVPDVARREWPLRQHQFNLNYEDTINGYVRRLLGSGPVLHWIVEDGRQFVALIDVHPGIFNQSHYIRLIVHPDWRGRLERPLIGRAVRYLYNWQDKKVTVKQPVDHIEAIKTYREFGFEEGQTLLWMRREMK